MHYVYNAENGAVEIVPKPDQRQLQRALQEQPDFKEIERLVKLKTRICFTCFLYNRCQPQEAHYEVPAPETFDGARIPYFDRVVAAEDTVLLWFVLVHSDENDDSDTEYRYLGRLVGRQILEQREAMQLHVKNSWFYGHQLPCDCLSLDGARLQLVAQEEGKKSIVATTTRMTQATFNGYCLGNWRHFDDVSAGFLVQTARRDVDAYFCFVAFTVVNNQDALKLLRRFISPTGFAALAKMYSAQQRQRQLMAIDRQRLSALHQYLGECSSEYHRHLKNCTQDPTNSRTSSTVATTAPRFTADNQLIVHIE